MKTAILLVLLTLGGTSVHAQELPDGLRGHALMTIDDARNKIVALAGAIENLDWRPGEGVRSVREVIGHVVGANYYFGTMLGTGIPEGVDPRAAGSLQEAGALIAALEASFDHVEMVLRELPDEQMDAPARWFDGSERPASFIVHFIPIHAHEHVGQLIAYARSNNVTPPWSE